MPETASRTNLDELRQQVAHAPVRVQPDPHLYAQIALCRLGRGHNAPFAVVVAHNPHRECIVRPLHHGLWRCWGGDAFHTIALVRCLVRGASSEVEWVGRGDNQRHLYGICAENIARRG